MSDAHQSATVEKLYLTGRYVKLRRDVSQTPFVLRNGQALSQTSVETVVLSFLKTVINGETFKFIPAGREDMDVRMVGTGRPFVVEIKRPSLDTLTETEMERLKAASSDPETGVFVRGWQLAKKDAIQAMKIGEEEMQKSYKALVWMSRHVTESDLSLLNHMKGLTVVQWTPLRVAHRRANASRQKTVHHMKASVVQGRPQCMVLELRTSAGCYIKEFIHGDFGRTSPSLHELLQTNETRCCALDVTHVDLDQSDSGTASLPNKRPRCAVDSVETAVVR